MRYGRMLSDVDQQAELLILGGHDRPAIGADEAQCDGIRDAFIPISKRMVLNETTEKYRGLANKICSLIESDVLWPNEGGFQ